MKSSKNQGEAALPISQNVGKATRSTVAAKRVRKTPGKEAPKSNDKAVISQAEVSDAPKKNGGTRKNVDAKKAVKNAVKFDKKITDKLKKIVANYTEYPELLNNIERDTTKSFIDELNIDSVDFVEIIVDVEQEFDITIEDDEIYDLKSFEDLYSAIETKIKKAKK